MQQVFTLDGVVKDMVSLGRLRKWMQDEAAKVYDFQYSDTKLENISYDPDNDRYTFSLVFYDEE